MRRILHFIDLLFRKFLVPLNSFDMKINPSENIFVEKLRKQVRTINIPKTDNLIHNQWLGNIITLKKDILTKEPKNFLQWEMIRKSMFIGNALFTLPEFLYLKKHTWNKWKKAIIEKKYVYTEPFLLYPKTSGNLVHYGYHLAKFESLSGKNIKEYDFIFEFGGGYGGMCLLIHNLGFKGKYIIYDFSILCALQNFFLTMNRVEKNVFCLDNIKKVKNMIPKKGKGLFIATWSLSESPLETRKLIYPLIKQFDAFLIGYQGQFGGVNNHQYFKSYQKNLTKHHWWNRKITQLKNNYYLFGFN